MTGMVVTAAVIPAVILLLCAVLARWRSSRRPPSLGVWFAPLPGSSVLYDALLWGQDRRAISAVVVDLAVNRKIRLIAQEIKGKRSTMGAEIVDGAQFTADESAVLQALFGPENSPGRVRKFSKDRVALANRLERIRDAADGRLADAGLIRRGKRRLPIVLLWFFGVGGVIATALLAIAAAVEEDDLAAALAIGSLLAVVAALAITPTAWRRFLPASDPLRAHLEGMREYIAVAEREPLRYLQSVQGAELRADVASDAELQRFLLNERLLPYAVIFGEEKSWARMLRLEGDALSRSEGVIDALAGISDLLTIIELTGGAIDLVLSLGELSDGVGGLVEGIGGLLDGL
ncbi:DUF2207 family protein [Microbacterium sp. ZW T5_45]|uniref:DUF2207 family protein n=1 Tax=Microbacterium sp. ZW T5_45 TaxID=3378080 RepID=UPI003852E87C